MTASKKTVRTRRGVEPVHPEGAAGPVVARLVLVVVLVRRHGLLRRENGPEEPPVHRSSSAQLDPIPNCLIFASARQDN